MEITPATRLLPHSDVLSREVDGEIVLLQVTSGLYFSLDAVGTQIWKRIPESGISLQDLRDQLLTDYDTTADRVDQDLQALVAELHEASLVVLS
jgi:hypothetical protein